MTREILEDILEAFRVANSEGQLGISDETVLYFREECNRFGIEAPWFLETIAEQDARIVEWRAKIEIANEARREDLRAFRNPQA
jgi:hypothetical protein